MPFHLIMYSLTILLRKADATKECGNDVKELGCWGVFGKLCIPLEKSWLRPCVAVFIERNAEENLRKST